MFKQNSLLKICIGSRTKNGKGESSERWFYQVILLLKRKGVSRPTFFFYRILSKLRPPIGLKNKQVAGSKVKIPSTIPIRQQYLKALRWIFEGARKRGRGNVTPQNFADELYCLAKNKHSYSFRLRLEYFKALLDSRAFLKYVK